MAKTQKIDHADYDSVSLKVGRRGPDKLLMSFSRTRFAMWVALSLCVHLSLAGFISYGFIRDNYIDPEGAARRQADALAAEKAAEKAAAPPTAAKAAAAKTPAAAHAESTKLPDGSVLPDDRKNAPVVKRITDTAKKGDIPKAPNDLGISVDDTQLK